MELRWIKREIPIGRNEYRIEKVLQYRVLETIVGSALSARDKTHGWSKWRDVPTVCEDK